MARTGHEFNGALLGRIRTERGLTQAQMATRLGIHWVTQSRIENGKVKVSLELLERIAEETGRDRNDFLAEPVAAAPSSDDDEEEASDMVATLFRQAVDAAVDARFDKLMRSRDGVLV